MSFASKIVIIAALIQSFIISAMTSYLYISHYILDHPFAYIYKMFDMSDFPKILDVL